MTVLLLKKRALSSVALVPFCCIRSASHHPDSASFPTVSAPALCYRKFINVCVGVEVPYSHGLCGEFDRFVFIIYSNPSFNVCFCITEMEKLKQRNTKQTICRLLMQLYLEDVNEAGNLFPCVGCCCQAHFGRHFSAIAFQ